MNCERIWFCCCTIEYINNAACCIWKPGGNDRTFLWSSVRLETNFNLNSSYWISESSHLHVVTNATIGWPLFFISTTIAPPLPPTAVKYFRFYASLTLQIWLTHPLDKLTRYSLLRFFWKILLKHIWIFIWNIYITYFFSVKFHYLILYTPFQPDWELAFLHIFQRCSD